MNLRFLASLPVAGLVMAAAVACDPSGSTPGPVFTPADASVQASAAASAAAELAVRCQPKGETVQAWEIKMLVSKGTRQAFYACEAIPKGDDDAVASCALTAAENAHKAAGAAASKEAGFIGALSACVSSLGATPAPSPSVSAK